MDMTEEEEYLARLDANRQFNQPYVKPGPRTFTTQLQPEQEQAFRTWVAQNKIPFNPNDVTSDYDMRGFWQGLQSGDPEASRAVDPHDQRLHFTDKWKTPYHRTFSADSQYANDQAPRWSGNQYLKDQAGTTLYDAAQPENALMGPRINNRPILPPNRLLGNR